MGNNPTTPNLYNRWRKAVLLRDNYRCIRCGSPEQLMSHHIHSFTHFPELRYEVDNGKTLCKSCHHKTENFGGGAIKYGKIEKY